MEKVGKIKLCALMERATSKDDIYYPKGSLAILAELQGYTVLAQNMYKITGPFELDKMIMHLASGKYEIKRIYIPSLSTLSNSVVIIINILDELSAKGISVYVHDIGMTSLNDDGGRNVKLQEVLNGCIFLKSVTNLGSDQV